jgi:predicted nucleic acid-binding protein
MNPGRDTNVVSELEGRHCSGRIIEWLNRFQPDELLLTTVSVAEIRYGISLLPSGKPRDTSTLACSRVEEGFVARILPFFARCGATLW